MQQLEKIQRLEIRSRDRAKYKRAGNKNKRMILNVFFGKVDVAAAYKHSLILMMEINPQLTQKIKVTSKFPIKTRNYGYLHKDYSQQSPKEKQVFRVSDITSCFASDLDPFDTLNKTYQQFLKSVNK